MEAALERVKQESGLIVPLLVMPEDDAAYLNHKAVFTHAGVPTQVCTLGVIQDENTLKWSVANIALQIFCKAGGLPWKVKSSHQSSVIIGISQSHKVKPDSETNEIEKYFAFSILTDSSGLFQRIQVLAEGEDEAIYLEALKSNLASILHTSSNDFSRVVIHTSFKLKHSEMDAIESVIKARTDEGTDAKTRFAVAKINHKTRFFGTNQAVNSLVPYEGTIVRLGFGEYLIWFEGIFPDRPTVTKAFAGPTHIQFQRFTEDKSLTDEILLQELMNLSGANWRGFNAKSAPVSVFYCHLVADLVHDFQQRGLPLPQVEDLRPWFL
jgi:argonaute-like protein implicated in RNA metabolism and viral defense